jgi:xylulokinase
MAAGHMLAIDLGTSAIKLMVMDRDLDVVGVERIPVRAGLHLDTWRRAIRDRTIPHGEAASIGAVVVTGQMHGLMPEYDTGIGEGIPWTDQRGAALMPELNDAFGFALPARIGGQLASGFQAVSLAWMKRHQPDDWARIRRVMLPKDAVIHALTGRHVTDPSDAAGTGMYLPLTGNWAWDIVDALGIPRDWLPRIIPSGSLVGAVTAEAANAFGIREGTAVIIAGGDAAVGAIGAVVTRSGQALVLLSTGAQIIQPIDVWRPDSQGRWYTWPSAHPVGSVLAPFLRVGTLLNAGLALHWLRGTLDDTDGRLFDLTPGDPTGILLVPYLIGERSPLSDPLARAAILGLSDSHSRHDIGRAALEGVAFSLRHALDTMTGDAEAPATIRLGGGGASNATWQQIITDVLGIPTQRIETTELSACGAALVGAHAMGWVNIDGWSRGSAASTVMMPEPRRRDRYDDLFAIYRDAVGAISPISHRLIAWRESQR